MIIAGNRKRFHAEHCRYRYAVVDVVAVALDGFRIKKGHFSAVPMVLSVIGDMLVMGMAAAQPQHSHSTATAADDDCSYIHRYVLVSTYVPLQYCTVRASLWLEA